MKRSLSRLLVAALITIIGLRISSGAEPAGQSVLTYHADPGRSGNFIVPSLTWNRASSLQLDRNFHARVSGHVYAQPLYWRGSESSSGVLLIATEDNVVHAIDAMIGQERWQRSLGKPVPRSSLSCGNISPVGVTGTPVIDASRGAIYLNAAVEMSSGLQPVINQRRQADFREGSWTAQKLRPRLRPMLLRQRALAGIPTRSRL